MSKISVEATPRPFEFDPAKAAVIVVDLTNDFGAKGGLFDGMGIPLGGIEKVAETTAKVLSAARRVGIKIVYVKMAFRPDLSDMGSENSMNRVGHLRSGAGKIVTTPDGKEGRILIRDTWNTEVLPAVAPQAGDIEMYKTRFSGFYETELHATLAKLDIKHLIFTGCTTSVCVESTMRDAMFRDYLSLLLSDCTCEPIGNDAPRSNHDASLTILGVMFGSISDSAQFIKACTT